MATAFVEEYKVFDQTMAPVDALLLKPLSLQELHEAIVRVVGRGDAANRMSRRQICQPTDRSHVAADRIMKCSRDPDFLLG